MTPTIEVAGNFYSFESIKEDLEGNEEVAHQVENPLAHVPLVDESSNPEFQYERLSNIAENLIATKKLSEITYDQKPLQSAMYITSVTLESDSVFSLKNVKEFFHKLMRALITLGRAIWGKIRSQARQFFASLNSLVRNLDYMEGIFKELSSKVDDNYQKTVDVTLGAEFRYLSLNDTTFRQDLLNLELERLQGLVLSVRDKVLPALGEISNHIARVIMENSEKNDPLMLLDTIHNSFSPIEGNEEIDFVGVPIDNYHPLLTLVPQLGELKRDRSPFIQGQAVASEPFLGGVKLFFKERSIGEKEKKAGGYSAKLFNRIRAYQELSVLFRRDGGVDHNVRSGETVVSINNNPRMVLESIQLAKLINSNYRDIIKDRNINLVESQAKLIEKALDQMGDVLNENEYSAESMEALKILTGYVQFMNTTSVFPFQDLSILVSNVTNAVGVYARKVFATYQVKE